MTDQDKGPGPGRHNVDLTVSDRRERAIVEGRQQQGWGKFIVVAALPVPLVLKLIGANIPWKGVFAIAGIAFVFGVVVYVSGRIDEASGR